MRQAAIAPVTRFDYQVMPEGPPYFQVIEGELVMSPSPTTVHQRILGYLHLVICTYLQRHPLGEVFLAPLDVFLSETNIFQPDLIFVSDARRSLITNNGIEGAPDLVVEVLSGRTAKHDRGSKRKVYAQSGVRELWLVDSEAKLIQVYRLAENAENPAFTADENSLLETPLFPGFKIRPANLFRSPHRG